MNKLKYTLLAIAAVYAGNMFSSLPSTATQTWRRIPKSSMAPQMPGPTFNRPYTANPRVLQTSQQTLAPQTIRPTEGNKVLLAKPFTYKQDSQDGFWARYQKGGLMAALLGLLGTNKQEELFTYEKAGLQKREDAAHAKVIELCGTDFSIDLMFEKTEARRKTFLEKIASERPKCAQALSDYYAAQISRLKEDLNEYYRSHTGHFAYESMESINSRYRSRLHNSIYTLENRQRILEDALSKTQTEQ